MQRDLQKFGKKRHASQQTPCTIHCQHQSLEQLVLNLDIYGKYVQPDTSLQRLVSTELHEIVTHLFPLAQAILLEPLVPGYSGSGVVKAQPFYAEQGGGRQFVIKFGDRITIEQEYANYEKYVQHFVSNGQHTALLGRYDTDHLGGLSYSLLGTKVNRMYDFGTWYNNADVDRVKQVIENLFRNTCGIWYANHSPLQPVDLTSIYLRQFRHNVRELAQLAATSLSSILSQQTLTFTSLHHTMASGFTNPFVALETIQPFIRSTYVCTTHGDFNQHNILLDQQDASWLIDFQRTEPGHILRDVAMLDTVIRFQLLRPEEEMLDELLAMEKILLSIEHLSQVGQLSHEFSATNPSLAKAYETVVHLRSLAYWLIEKNPEADISEYYIALLYTTLNTLRFASLDARQREYALLSGSLLVDYLRAGKRFC